MTPITLAFIQLLHLTLLYVPMGWPRLGLPRGTRLGMGYLASNALALFVGYALDMLGWFSVSRMFVVWVIVGAVLSAAFWPHWERRPPGRLRRTETRIGVLLAAGMVMAAWIRLADPFQNAALAGIDSYSFVNFYSWILAEGRAIDYYPSGFALVTSMAPWPVNPYEAARWAPHIVFLACLPASFGFWRRVAGLRAALVFTLLIGTAWFLYPLTAYYPHFIQWTMGFVGIPATLFIFSCLARRPSAQTVLMGVAVNAVFTMTSGYFALYVNGVLLVVTALTNPCNKTGLRTVGAAGLVALTPPCTLLAYYGLLTRFFYTAWDVRIDTQSEVVNKTVSRMAYSGFLSDWIPWEGLGNHPLFRVIVSYVVPTLPVRPTARWVLYSGLLALGLWMWRTSRARRHAGIRLLAGLTLGSVFSAMTGVFELPAWEGRNVFVAVFAGLALFLGALTRGRPVTLWRWAARAPVLSAIGVALVASPSLLWPPMIGRNVPITDAIHPRCLPGDNRVMDELIRGNRRGEDPVLAVVRSSEHSAPLIQNLLRLEPPAREHAFLGYRLMPTDDLARALEQDAVLVTEGEVAESALQTAFDVHTRGRGFVFALRRPAALNGARPPSGGRGLSLAR